MTKEKEFNYSFSKKVDNYVLNAGNFGAGSYKYVAKTSYNGTIYREVGEFAVKEQQAELKSNSGKSSIAL